MKLSKQVVSLEQAKKLKELGVEQESLFCFIGDDNPDPKYNLPHKLYLTNEAYSEVGAGWYENRIAAFTVAELGVMLPEPFVKRFDFPGYTTPKSKKYEVFFSTWFWDASGKRTFGCRYDHDGNINISLGSSIGCEAEARAALLIHLIENNHITVEAINQRLTND